MFGFSTKTAVTKELKLSDLFRQMNASREVKRDAANVEKVTLISVISPLTLNCEPNKTVKEIYVIEIVLSIGVLPELFIKELDKSIKLHTLFIIRHGDYEVDMMSYKLGTQKGKYYKTNWEKTEIKAVPVVTNVPDAYKYLLSTFMQYPPKGVETPEEYIKRNNALNKLDFQIGKLQSAVANEKESKKKFEYNAKLKDYIAQRETLL